MTDKPNSPTSVSALASTPGPWRVIRDADHKGNRRVVSFHPVGVAKVYADEPREDDERAISNAHLIAAAPDLVVALEAYLFAEEIDDPAIRQAELAVARQDARAALAKAGTPR